MYGVGCEGVCVWVVSGARGCLLELETLLREGLAFLLQGSGFRVLDLAPQCAHPWGLRAWDHGACCQGSTWCGSTLAAWRIACIWGSGGEQLHLVKFALGLLFLAAALRLEARLLLSQLLLLRQSLFLQSKLLLKHRTFRLHLFLQPPHPPPHYSRLTATNPLRHAVPNGPIKPKQATAPWQL